MVEILNVLEKLDDITYEASSGEVLDEELIQIDRRTETETYKKHGVYKQVARMECW